MGPTDDDLFAMLLEQLGEAGEVAPEIDGDVIVVRGQPGQRVPKLRLHLTPALLGQALKDLAPDYAPVFPRMKPLEAALVAFWVHLMAAMSQAGPGAVDVELAAAITTVDGRPQLSWDDGEAVVRGRRRSTPATGRTPSHPEPPRRTPQARRHRRAAPGRGMGRA